MVTPYLPDIMEAIVQRVSDYFEARDTDPFAVFFEKGNHPQVSQAVYTNDINGQARWPIIWLDMPEQIAFGNWRVYGEANVEIWIVVPTDNNYTQQQRDDISFKPRLVPIAERFMMEVKRDRWFQLAPGELQHSRQKLPFWGFGAVNGTDKENALGKFIDAIRIRIPKLPIRKQNCNVGRPYPQLT